MTQQIQGRAGDSLAGIYDVVGGSANVSELHDQEVQLVHEMGHLILAERLRTAIRLVQATTVAQSTSFNAAISDLPGTPYRLQNAILFLVGSGALTNATVSLELEDGSRSIPLLNWDSVPDASSTMQFTFGGSLISALVLRPGYSAFPILGLGEFQGQPVNQCTPIIRLAGTTTAFGAGTIDINCILQVTHSHLPGLQQQPTSYGLPIPSW